MKLIERLRAARAARKAALKDDTRGAQTVEWVLIAGLVITLVVAVFGFAKNAMSGVLNTIGTATNDVVNTAATEAKSRMGGGGGGRPNIQP